MLQGMCNVVIDAALHAVLMFDAQMGAPPVLLLHVVICHSKGAIGRAPHLKRLRTAERNKRALMQSIKLVAGIRSQHADRSCATQRTGDPFRLTIFVPAWALKTYVTFCCGIVNNNNNLVQI